MHQNINPPPDKHFLQSIFTAALRPTLPRQALQHFVAPETAGRIYLFAAGKAASQMAAAVRDKVPGDLSGLVITRRGYADPGFTGSSNLPLIEASHPVPDAAGLQAAQQAVREIAMLGEDDLLLALISGGASALLPLPAPELTLAEKQSVTRDLLTSGAAISEMNIVRKHLSAIKGGRLAAAAFPARTLMIGISDVPGDDLGTIGSGPTVGDPSTLEDARDIIARYGIEVPTAVAAALDNPANETPKPDSPLLARSDAILCARPADLIAAAAAEVRRHGYQPHLLGDDLEGEAVALGRDHAQLAMQLAKSGEKIAVISGGEATVRVSNRSGRGGRNTAFLLSCALHLRGQPGIAGFAADTDGIDGSEDNAGAFLWPGCLEAMGGEGQAQRYLDADNSYAAFAQADALMMTGPTGTNVNDLRILLVN